MSLKIMKFWDCSLKPIIIHGSECSPFLSRLESHWNDRYVVLQKDCEDALGRVFEQPQTFECDLIILSRT